MKIRMYLITGFVLFAGILFAQENNKVLATIGNKNFTVDEFVQRYELIPQVNAGKQKDEALFRNREFYTIIAEKLWAQYAEELGYDSSDVMKYTYKALEKMYVRDALYQREIKNKAKVDENKIKFAYEKVRRTLYVNFIFSRDKNEINQLYAQLKSGIPFDTLLNKRIDIKYQKTPIEVNFGAMREDIEDSLFSLPQGGYTQPVDYNDEWYIFRLTSSSFVDFKDSQAFQKALRDAKDLVTDRALDKVYAEYFNKFFVGKKVETNGYLFWSICDRLIEVLQNRKDKDSIQAGAKIALTADDFAVIENKLTPDTLKMNFIQFETEPVTVFQFLREFFYEGFEALSANADTIRSQMQSRVKRFIENELLARQGYKEGLQNLPDVQASTNMWKENYLAKMVKNKFIEDTKLSEDELKDYYDNNKERMSTSIMVNILEILTDNLDDIDTVMKALDKGVEFRDLAKKYSKRLLTKDKGGEFGYFNANLYGEIGQIAANMKIGEVYGPIKVPDGYSIFKLIDKKEPETQAIKPFEEIKDSLRGIARTDKLHKQMVDKTVELAKKYGVKVNENVLHKLDAVNLNMLVYRFMGFGGRILAVPIDPMFADWVEAWQKDEDSLP